MTPPSASRPDAPRPGIPRPEHIGPDGAGATRTGSVLPGAGLLGEDRLVCTPDGRRLRAMVAGEGEDLVVLEAGLGASGLFWGSVHRRLAARARVVAYDRAGYGGSDPADGPRDLERLADDLETLVDAFPHRRLVLVGHSWGGPVVRVAAARRMVARRIAAGRELAGLVLVDPTDEHCDLYFSRAFRAQSALQDRLLEPLARTGLLRRYGTVVLSDLPRPLRSEAAGAAATPTAARTMRAEDEALVAGLRRLRDQPLDLGELPVSVISGRKSGPLERAIRDELSRAHRMTAGGLVAGRYVEARESRHLVPLTEPDLVAAEALAVLDK